MKRRLALFLNKFKFTRNWRWVNRECLEALVERMSAERVARRKKEAELREARRLKNAADFQAAIEQRQRSCRHLKGGKYPLTWKADYAVGKHTFIDGHVEVWCLVCQKQFDPNGEEATIMLANTTNSKSSSERVFEIKDREYPWGSKKGDYVQESIGDNTIWSSPGAAITKKLWDMYKAGIQRRTQKFKKENS